MVICNSAQISQLIFNIFSFDKVQLTLDRTNWKWGKRDINILMFPSHDIGFISIFGKDRIVNVFADREFIGEKWFTWLIENSETKKTDTKENEVKNEQMEETVSIETSDS